MKKTSGITWEKALIIIAVIWFLYELNRAITAAGALAGSFGNYVSQALGNMQADGLGFISALQTNPIAALFNLPLAFVNALLSLFSGNLLGWLFALPSLLFYGFQSATGSLLSQASPQNISQNSNPIATSAPQSSALDTANALLYSYPGSPISPLVSGDNTPSQAISDLPGLGFNNINYVQNQPNYNDVGTGFSITYPANAPAGG